MAIYNEMEVQRFARLLQKVFGIKGSAPVRQLAGEVITVFPLPNGVENRYPESWMVYGKAVPVSSVAGQFSFAQLRNPLNSGVLAVVDKVCVSEGAIDVVFLSITNAVVADATTVNVFGMDSRNTGSSSLIASGGTQVAAPQFAAGVLWEVNLAANSVVDYVQDSINEIPVLPGLTLRLNGSTVNQNLNANFRWRERALEDSEVR